ncbi:putative C4-dicarboxylate transporter/malic acid transport protein [Aspergillus affinis]|uniref:putative C4-dicarboxylate transporter/malic acid transport protein n=1 Tax=Aspergillus affinis TaxID=1070780 RepID=UPI0022FEC8CB|nr:C4-dicarboxylate/malic acid transporter [Aspergillus affinis]KAI9035499.1 C4-dicarboxylate/malic acid transporter [Aspergillus affinis]
MLHDEPLSCGHIRISGASELRTPMINDDRNHRKACPSPSRETRVCDAHTSALEALNGLSYQKHEVSGSRSPDEKGRRRRAGNVPTDNLGWKERIRHFTWAFFTLTMATGGIANVLYSVPYRFRGLETIGIIFFLVNLVLYVVIWCLLLTRFYLYPYTFKASFLHPTESLFVPASLVSFGTILVNISQYGPDHAGPWLTTAVGILFWIDAALAVISSAGIYLLLWSTQTFTIAQMTPIWIFPAYPLLIIGPHAGILSSSLEPVRALRIIIGGITIQGVGFLVSLMVYSAFIYRLMSQKLPRENLRPGMFVSVGPSAFTVSGIVNMASNAKRCFPSDFMGNGALAAEVVKVVANFSCLWLWGLALFFFFIATFAHWSVVGPGKMVFSMGWYSFVFPNTALVTATFAIGKAFSCKAINIVGCAMVFPLILTWIFVTCMMVRAIVIRQILWPQKGEDKDEGGFDVNRVRSGLASAFTTFNTNCTLPADHERVNYVSSPNIRGTLSIVWSYLFTIIACTWTVQHPDVPWQRKHYDDGKLGWWKWKLGNAKHSTAWFLGTIIAPEIILVKHLADLLEARKLAKDFNKYKGEGGIVWTQTHLLFAIMGGFVMRTNVPKEKISHREGLSSQPKKAGASSPPSENPENSAPNGDTIVVEAGLLESDIDKPPLAKEIEDKSKSDNLMRLIAVFQILWLCIQVIARAVGDLAVSQLEIATVAFSLCAVIMYGLSWNKPKAVQTPITILQVPDDGRGLGLGSILEPERTPGKDYDSSSENSHQKTPSWAGDFWEKMERHWRTYIKANSAVEGDTFIKWIAKGVILTGMLFGRVHVVAWNSYFPTHTELLLWRVAALYCTCFPLGLFVLFWIMVIFAMPFIQAGAANGTDEEAHTPSPKKTLGFIGGLIMLFMLIMACILFFVFALSYPVFVLARLYILVEMFRTVAFQPTGAFIGTWAVNMPNVN